MTAIVDAFDGTSTELSLAAVAARAELPRSTTHRILEHLVRQEWMSHSKSGYRLGRRSLAGGAGHTADLRLRAAAAPVINHLHLTTSAVVVLGVLEDGRIVHLDRVGNRASERVPVQVGSSVAAHRLGLGVAVLGALSTEEVAAQLSYADAAHHFDSAFGLELHRVRQTGTAHRLGDYGPRLASVVATINSRAALGIILPRSASPRRYLPLVRAAAVQVNGRLGEADT